MAPRSMRLARGRLVGALLAVAVVLLPAPRVHAQEPAADRLATDLSAEGAVLWDPLDDRVLWERDGDASRRMASTTKIMTALLAVEAGTIDDLVTVSSSAASADATPGAATLQLGVGQRLVMRDLLQALMMRSGNDAAAAVAEHVAGTQPAFVDRMNERARELGLDDTNFLDTTGLSNSADHHASPVDLARLAQHAMRRPAFADLVDDYRADVPGIGTLTSRNLLLDTYRGATGVKTGYTALAGLCLVASATRDGRTLFSVVLNSDDSFGDSAALLDHGFDAFAVASAADAAVGVYRTARGTAQLRVVDTAPHTVPVDATVQVRSLLSPTPPERIERGTRLGRAELIVDGQVVDTAGLEAAGPSEAGDAGEAAPSGRSSDATTAGAAVEDALRSLVRATPRTTPLPSEG